MRVFRVDRQAQYRKAGLTDIVRLLPAPRGGNPLFIKKETLELLVTAITNGEFTHLSGPTGSSKTSLLEALYLVPENFEAICRGIDKPIKPLKLFPIELVTFETPGELFQRRALDNGTTFDEPSPLVRALEEAAAAKGECYPLVWLREMGRVHSSSIQGGLLNLMCGDDILLPDGRRIGGRGIAWITDSNYQAESGFTHTLVTLDAGLNRRFSVNLTLDYLTAEQEEHVLHHLVREMPGGGTPDEDAIRAVVQLGQRVRERRAKGELQSLAPPTIYGYLAFMRMARSLPHFSLQQIANGTLLGNASVADKEQVDSLVMEVFGLHVVNDGAEVPSATAI